MNKIIKLKLSIEYFEKDKYNELEARLADFNLKEGDLIRFLEWDRKKKTFSGRFYDKEVKSFHRIRSPFRFWKKKDLNKYGIYVLKFDRKPVYEKRK